MMRSMTGFGQASWQGAGRRIAVEVRSVNQRFLDLRLNLPREYQPLEDELRQLVMSAVHRGKVDIAISRAGSSAGEFEVEINEELARASIEGWRRLQRRLGLGGEIDVSFILGRSEFVRIVERRRAADADFPHVRQLLVRAVRAFNRAREREGRALARDMAGRVNHLKQIHMELKRRSTVLVPELQRRLSERLAVLLGDRKVTEDRLIQEAALLAERADVTEELVRLASHLERLSSLLSQREPAGKPIDFLLQEVHREINTIASKSADLQVTNLSLEARAEVEKLREQTQNVE